jgi:hypothetical protein
MGEGEVVWQIRCLFLFLGGSGSRSRESLSGNGNGNGNDTGWLVEMDKSLI